MALKNQQLSREDVAKIEIGRTAITASRSWVLIALFVATVTIVPGSQVVYEVRGYLAGLRDTPLPQAVDIFRYVPAAAKKLADTHRAPLGRVFKANATMLRSINTFEDDLEDQSLLGRIVLSPTQCLLTGWLGAGNEEAYIGRGQWLFYRPGIDYLTGPGFLDPRQLAKRGSGGSEWQAAPHPDPRAAIIDFKQQLARRGIALIVVPTPVKPMIHPEKFSSNCNGSGRPLQNPSFDRFRRELEENGVLVFDAADVLMQARLDTGRPQYLATDTHWRPQAMELVAAALKTFIERHVDLPPVPRPRYKGEAAVAENFGDIAAMLKLPDGQRMYRKERVTIHQVISAAGELWRADKGADILLLGDSFTNVYSLEAMGWGSSAGLAEQLSYHLERPLDCIARNDNAAFATRETLSRHLARGRDRLAGKRVVVYQFANRELAVGDWKPIGMKLGEPRPSKFVVPEPGTEMIVSGLIEEMSPVPKPRSVPYKDHIVSIHLVDLATEEGPVEGGEAVVYMWSMRDNVWTPAARRRAGSRIALRLRSWYDVADQLDAIKRSELSSEALALEEPCWGEEK